MDDMEREAGNLLVAFRQCLTVISDCDEPYREVIRSLNVYRDLLTPYTSEIVSFMFDYLVTGVLSRLRQLVSYKDDRGEEKGFIGQVESLLCALHGLLTRCDKKSVVSCRLYMRFEDLTIPVARLLELPSICNNEDCVVLSISIIAIVANLFFDPGLHRTVQDNTVDGSSVNSVRNLLIQQHGKDHGCDVDGSKRKGLIGICILLFVKLLTRPGTSNNRRIVLEIVACLREYTDSVRCCDTLSAFYPGVCTALSHLLSKGDYKLGSKVYSEAAIALRKWISRVLGDFRATAAPSSEDLLESINSPHNAYRGKQDWFTEASRRTLENLNVVLTHPSTCRDLGTPFVEIELVKLCTTALSSCRSNFLWENSLHIFEYLIMALNALDKNVAACVEEAMPHLRVFMQESCRASDEGMLPHVRRRVTAIIADAVSLHGCEVSKRLSVIGGYFKFIHSLPSGTTDCPWMKSTDLGEPLLCLFRLDPSMLSDVLEDETSLVSCPSEELQMDSLTTFVPKPSIHVKEVDHLLYRNIDPRVFYRHLPLQDTSPRTYPSGLSPPLCDSEDMSTILDRCLRVTEGASPLLMELEVTVNVIVGCLRESVILTTLKDFMIDPVCRWGFYSPSPSDVRRLWARRAVREAQAGQKQHQLSRLTVLRRCNILYTMRFIMKGIARNSTSSTCQPEMASTLVASRATQIDCSRGFRSVTMAVEEILEMVVSPNVWIDPASEWLSASMPDDENFDPSIEKMDSASLAAFYTSTLLSLISQCIATLYCVAGSEAVKPHVKYLLLPVLSKLGTPSFLVSSSAMNVIVQLYRILGNHGSTTPTPSLRCNASSVSASSTGFYATSWLLGNYADYLIDDVSSMLSSLTPVYSISDPCASTGGLLTAIIMFAPHSMIPLLSGIVCELAEGRPALGQSTMPIWVSRVMAATSYLLSSKVLLDRRNRRDITKPTPGSPTTATVSRQDLHAVLNEDGDSDEETGTGRNGCNSAMENEREYSIAKNLVQPFDVPSLQTAPVRRKPGGEYSLIRQMANAAMMRMRYHLSDRSLRVRCYAYSTILRGLCVMSTKKYDLLPNVHHIWPTLCASINQDAPIPALSLACGVVSYISFLCGDFVKRRFLADVFPKLSNILQLYDLPATESDAERNSYDHRQERYGQLFNNNSCSPPFVVCQTPICIIKDTCHRL
eukprot:GHVQ01030543.1.p1 GENE.GHVQ01030543.1~~GHVQ01030543.1.p1  ORF type:complete len:1179 (+),score=127.38 GHVQ01030543.1:96-3632(+)